MANTLVRCRPEDVGISPTALVRFLDKAEEDGSEIHNVMMLRHGKVFFEASYAPYMLDQPHQLNSFTKSIVSIAVGFAWQEGKLDLEERIVDIFPECAPSVISENLSKCRVRHLLCMTGGKTVENVDARTGLDTTEAWVRSFLADPFVYEPGTHFAYTTSGTNFVCAILKRKTGEAIDEYLKPRLFDPIGVKFECTRLRDGTCYGGGGGSMTIEGMARFAQFCLNRGAWDGKQLLLPEYIDMMSAEQASTVGNQPADWGYGYGYFFWRSGRPTAYRCSGMMGQFGIVYPEKDIAVAINGATLGQTGSQAPLDALWELTDGIESETIPHDETGTTLLNYLKDKLSVPVLQQQFSRSHESVCGTYTYISGDKPLLDELSSPPIGLVRQSCGEAGLERIMIQPEQDRIDFTLWDAEHKYHVSANIHGKFNTVQNGDVLIAANGRWRTPTAFEFEMRSIRTIAGLRVKMVFEDDKLTMYSDSTAPTLWHAAKYNMVTVFAKKQASDK